MLFINYLNNDETIIHCLNLFPYLIYDEPFKML